MSSITDWLSGIASKIADLPSLIADKFSGTLSSMTTKLANIGTYISNLPSNISEALKEKFTSITTWLSDIWSGISGLPDLIVDGVKGVFVPDEETLQGYFDRVTKSCESLVVYYDLKELFSVGKKFDDIEVTIYGHTATIVETDSLQTALDAVRPYIRGFITLLLVLFHVNQFLSLIGQAPISIIGKIAGRETNVNDN